MIGRELIEKREYQILSPFAAKVAESRGRCIPEEPCKIRTDYQRDKDRIIHSKAFRRLMHKTQVFLAPEGDHFRTRLTHTIEVSQIARTVARSLGLNEDLTEAIAMGHDLGHTPFGHNGEKVLDSIQKRGFHHNIQSLRVADVLESSHSRRGMNLTQEVRDGIVNHKGEGIPYTLEGQIVRLSDKIAYINHDIDDAIRGGILKPEDLPEKYTKLLGTTTRSRLDTMVHNVIINSMEQPKIQMSEEIEEAMSGLRKFLFEHVYLNPKAKGEETKAINMISNLFEYYMEHMEALPEEFLKMTEERGESKERIVCDYIAGMTDNYAVKKFQEYFVPESWKF